ncbi:MAG: iron-containing alcohol dehydrogenase [Rikenellaceae bacterium]
MNRFEFYNPVRVIFGAGEVENVATEAKKFGNKVCLVSYKELLFLEPLMDRITKLLEKEGIEVFPFYEIEANPEITVVAAGSQYCKDNGVNLVIGVGGGSAMDAAKVVAAGVYYEGDMWNMVYSRHDGGASSTVPPTKALPLMMIPTLPATGSEMNQCAVVSNKALKEKSYIWAACLFPTVSIVDPELTLTLPLKQSAYAAADTISHVLEIYINGEEDSDLQHYFQEGVMRTVIDNFPRVMADPKNVSARSHLQWAATCAINGWASPGDAWTPIHQVAHGLTSLHGVPHGASLAMLMPSWMELFSSRRPARYFRFATNVMLVDPTDKTEEAVIAEGIEKFSQFLNDIGAGLKMSDMGITAENIPAIVDNAVKVSFGADGYLSCNPPVSKQDVINVLEKAL